MKTSFSLPKDEGFFNRYATLIPTLQKLGVLSQIINAITEIGIIYAVVFSLLSEFWGSYAAPLAVFGAIVGTSVLELGLRKFLPYSCRAILYKRFSGLDVWMSSFILITCLALFACSLTLSFRGSKAMVESSMPAPDLKNTGAADQGLASGRADAAQTFSRDSSEIAARYAGQITAETNAFAAKINGERTVLNRYQRTPQKYKSLINATKSKVLNLEAEKSGTVAGLEAAKAKEMQEAADRKHADMERITAAHTATAAEINTQNATARLKTENRTRVYGSGLAWFTLIFHFILILAVALDEVNKKGSGIEQVAQPNQYHFSESIWAAFLNTISDKWNYNARTKIQRWADKTPAPPRPVEPPPLFELADWMPRRVTLPALPQTQNDGGKMSFAVPPELAEKAQNNAAKSLNLKVQNGGISAKYSPPDTPPPPVGNAPAPVRDNEMSYSETTEKVVTVDSSLKPCGFCGELFRPKTTWQKFCKTDCKLAEHEQRHGQRFDPAKAKFKKKITA